MVLGLRGTDIWLLTQLGQALREERRTVLVGSDTFCVLQYSTVLIDS